MIKKRVGKHLLFVSLAFLIVILSLSNFLAASSCDLSASLVNQDPYPAIPGDYVKLVFQVTGAQNPDCGVVTIRLLESFPFSLDEGTLDTYSSSSFFKYDYTSTIVAPYTVRVDKEAIDGENIIELSISSNQKADAGILKRFNVTVEDKRADFEIHVKDYKSATNILTLEILNIGKYDIKALSVEIPKQDKITIKGASKNIVGDLDSNEYTTADFEAIPQNGEINLIITYTDGINVRRTLEKSVLFDSSYFDDRKSSQTSTPTYYYVIIVIVIIVAVLLFRRFRKKKRSA